MKILITGKNGQLGWELQRACAPLGEIFAVDKEDLDFSHPNEISDFMEGLHPDLIINPAAYTAVDRAESEVKIAAAINTQTPAILATVARKISAGFIHYSTDFVFDGQKKSPYTEADRPNPLNVYGKTKLEGEERVREVGGNYVIFRTSWVYSTRADSFLLKFLQWARNNQEVRIVEDQFGSPTCARMLAQTTALFIAQGGKDWRDWLAGKSGLYHLAGDGTVSRYEWAMQIYQLWIKKEPLLCKKVIPALTSSFPSPAERPPFSGLDCSNFSQMCGLRLPSWRDALALTIAEM